MFVAQFIDKIHRMIINYPEIIGWTENGSEFGIFNQEKLQVEILPLYFKHVNLESFVRQLNMYNFKKISRKKNTIYFRNEFFKRGNEQNFHLIKRRKITSQKKKVTPQSESSFQECPSSEIALSEKFQQFTDCHQKMLANLGDIFHKLESQISCPTTPFADSLKELKTIVSSNDFGDEGKVNTWGFDREQVTNGSSGRCFMQPICSINSERNVLEQQNFNMHPQRVQNIMPIGVMNFYEEAFNKVDEFLW